MNDYEVKLLENILYVSMINEIDKISRPYTILKFDFTNNGIDIENFAETQKQIAKELIIKPTKQKIESYINETLNEQQIFPDLHRRLLLYSNSLVTRYFPEVEL